MTRMRPPRTSAPRLQRRRALMWGGCMCSRTCCAWPARSGQVRNVRRRASSPRPAQALAGLRDGQLLQLVCAPPPAAADTEAAISAAAVRIGATLSLNPGAYPASAAAGLSSPGAPPGARTASADADAAARAAPATAAAAASGPGGGACLRVEDSWALDGDPLGLTALPAGARCGGALAVGGAAWLLPAVGRRGWPAPERLALRDAAHVAPLWLPGEDGACRRARRRPRAAEACVLNSTRACASAHT